MTIIRSMTRAGLFLCGISTIIPLWAQGDPPCGVVTVKAEGKKDETRFFAHSPALVKKRMIQALSAVGAEVKKDEGGQIEAAHEWNRMLAAQNVTGVWANKKGAMGRFDMRLTARTQDGAPGTLVEVHFKKKKLKGRGGSDGWATPLLEETACLLSSLHNGDPEASPRGPGPEASAAAGPVTLPAGTPVKALLDDALYTRGLQPDSRIVFQAAEDVQLQGQTVIRRGALITGKFTRVAKAKNFGRGAGMEFVIDSAVAVNGQKIALTSEAESKGQTNSQVGSLAKGGGAGLLAGALVKGGHSLIRAGTGFTAQVAADQRVETPGR